MGNASELDYAPVRFIGILFLPCPEQGNYCLDFVRKGFPFSILTSFKRVTVGRIL